MITTNLNDFSKEVFEHNLTMGWWKLDEEGNVLPRNAGELFMLMVTELAEGFEGIRKDLMDDKLPHRKMEEVELADTIIRICDYAGYKGFDLDGAIAEKREFNANRPDHKLENRAKEGGKKF